MQFKDVMKIDLHNFFLHYDPKNPKHVAAVEKLEKDLEQKQPELIQDDSEWVEIFREKAPVPAHTGVLVVPYYPQTDNYRDADRTCNSSSCAMCLEYLKPGTLKGAKGDDAYVQKVFAIGDSTDHTVQTRVLESYGVKSLVTIFLLLILIRVYLLVNLSLLAFCIGVLFLHLVVGTWL
jgi:hypothetical protein